MKWILISESIGHFAASGPSINLSSEWSRLIKEAATCEAFASDLLYDYESFQEKLAGFGEDEQEFESWFGFRTYGVDHKAFIDQRWGEYTSVMRAYRDGRILGDFTPPECPYRSIFKIEVKTDPKYKTWIRAELYEADFNDIEE